MVVIKDSKFFSEIAKKRKNPYRPFKDDPEYAKKMSAKAAEARKRKAAERKAENERRQSYTN